MRYALAALVLSSSAAFAQQVPCGPTGSVEKSIKDKYGESIVGAGIARDGNIMFTLANPDSGTWTILLRRQDGQTCIMAGGTGYAAQEAVKPGADL